MQITSAQLRTLTNAIRARVPSKEEFSQQLSPKPKKINSYAGEKEILRKGNVLVTDTRLAFIDPNDRTLKTYMFEHMISLNKIYYRTTTLNQRLCKLLLFLGLITLLITLIIDLLDSDSRGFVLVYIPAILSLLIGLLVWRDMRPKYRVEWKMRDGSTDKIATEPMFREWLRNSKKRESFMDDLTQAMNEALSAKAWWPGHGHTRQSGVTRSAGDHFNGSMQNNNSQRSSEQKRNHLKLVTEHYE